MNKEERRKIIRMAISDSTTAIRESGDTTEPDGGWDAWLINGVGVRRTCELFGEPEEESQSGWSEAMRQKLDLYAYACREAIGV